MKKLLLLLSVFVLVSCSKDDEETSNTSYQIINNAHFENSNIEGADGTLYDIIVFKFIGDDVAGEDNLDNIPANGGTSDVIPIDERIDKIKVSFKLIPEEADQYDISDRMYTTSYTFITDGQVNTVTISNNTATQRTLR